MRVWKDLKHEPGFLWRPQGKASERREGILRYVEQARRRLDEAGTQKDGSESGDDGWEAPPVPIPNTAVKLPRVESTGLEAAWEDRLLPVIQTPPQNNLRGRLLLSVCHFQIVLSKIVLNDGK